MTEPIRLEVLADEHIDEEETVSGDELFNNIMAGFAELENFAQADTAKFSGSQANGEQAKALRVTEYIDGECVPPAMLTLEELAVRRASRKGSTPSSAAVAASSIGTGYAVSNHSDMETEPTAGYAVSHRADMETEPTVGQTTTKAGTAGHVV